MNAHRIYYIWWNTASDTHSKSYKSRTDEHSSTNYGTNAPSNKYFMETNKLVRRVDIPVAREVRSSNAAVTCWQYKWRCWVWMGFEFHIKIGARNFKHTLWSRTPDIRMVIFAVPCTWCYFNMRLYTRDTILWIIYIQYKMQFMILYEWFKCQWI